MLVHFWKIVYIVFITSLKRIHDICISILNEYYSCLLKTHSQKKKKKMVLVTFYIYDVYTRIFPHSKSNNIVSLFVANEQKKHIQIYIIHNFRKRFSSHEIFQLLTSYLEQSIHRFKNIFKLHNDTYDGYFIRTNIIFYSERLSLAFAGSFKIYQYTVTQFII